MKTIKKLPLKNISIQQQGGFLMVEVLVSFIIFSICMIGLMQLQTKSMTSGQSAQLRTMASNYAYDMLDKMRGNRDGVLAGYYISMEGLNKNCRSVNFNTSNSSVINCNIAQLAQDDLKEFQSQVATLPQGQSVICKDSSRAQGTPTAPNCDNTGDDYVIKVFWKDINSKTTGENSGYSQVILGAQI